MDYKSIKKKMLEIKDTDDNKVLIDKGFIISIIEEALSNRRKDTAKRRQRFQLKVSEKVNI
ncbi:MAG: hypothetical protein IKV70_06830 [Phascolarctobacterium sp.]|nr:hypothetical protein [Phascolarctobacterium sp.]